MAQKPVARKLPDWLTKRNKVLESTEKKKQSLVFPGAIQYCNTIGDMGLACEKLIYQAEQSENLILGFDAEWPVHFQGSGKIALIQVCCDENTCYLFHVSCMRSFPKIFQDLIKHPKVVLVGNCITNDIWKLGKDFNFPVAKLIQSGHVIDLGELANQVLSSAQTWSLDRLALHLLSVVIDKTDSIRKSRWDLELSSEQQLYAATDAYISLLIHNKLKQLTSSED
ncbi:Werner syndrome ATP-dependent helicase-like protein [Frankliniella fusca]|uniref:3'-5' exonuclease n=1 Tax=Frankliniella fusca TaxID=407009 RepID=A0AAE1H218_9NEOP|nr:Werner syndrome ATP-dependent helicase-like protein [Frankliniella fusca]